MGRKKHKNTSTRTFIISKKRYWRDCRLRGWLHGTGMNSDLEEFRSVPIRILLSDYMRPVQKLNSDRDRNENLRPGQLWTETTCNRKKFQTGLSFCAHGALRQRSSMRKSLQCSQNGGRKAGKNITHAVAETNITKHLSCSWRTSMTFSS